MDLVLPFYLFFGVKRISDERCGVEVYFVHIYRCYLAVVVGGVVVNSAACVAARGVNCDFVFSVFKLT